MASIQFAINTADCKLILPSLSLNTLSTEDVVLRKGNLVKLSNLNGGTYFARVYSNDGGELRQSDKDYICKVHDFTFVTEQLWMMLIAVNNVDRRVVIMRRETFKRFLSKLRVGSNCNVSGRIFNREENIRCFVKYIGAVPEIGPGTFFGFLLQDPMDAIPPKTQLPSKYFTCTSQNGFIRAADALLFLNNNTAQQKHSICFEPINKEQPSAHGDTISDASTNQPTFNLTYQTGINKGSSSDTVPDLYKTKPSNMCSSSTTKTQQNYSIAAVTNTFGSSNNNNSNYNSGNRTAPIIPIIPVPSQRTHHDGVYTNRHVPVNDTRPNPFAQLPVTTKPKKKKSDCCIL